MVPLTLLLLLAGCSGDHKPPTTSSAPLFPDANLEAAVPPGQGATKLYPPFKVAYAVEGAILLTDSNGSPPTALIEGPKFAAVIYGFLTWSPDGQRLAFNTALKLYLVDVGGGGEPVALNQETGEYVFLAWSPDGQRLAFSRGQQSPVNPLNYQICAIEATGGEMVNLTNYGGYDSGPTWSPNGRKIAFVTDRDGNYELYTMDPEGGHLTRLTNSPGADGSPTLSPEWSSTPTATARPTSIWSTPTAAECGA